MTPLARLQRNFQSHVLDGDRRFRREVADTARVPAGRRLAIYSSAYRTRLVESLEADYAGLRALIGEARFRRIARQYVNAHPSPFFNLRWYGAGFASFLRNSSRRRGPALGEMADFEWQLGLAFDAADVTPITIEDMASVAPEDWPRMRFATHPSVRLLNLRYNVTSVFTAVQDEKPQPALACAKTPVSWLVWRQALTAHFRSLEADEARALGALMRGADFGEICGELSDSPEPALRAAALLKRWIIDGLMTSSRKQDS